MSLDWDSGESHLHHLHELTAERLFEHVPGILKALREKTLIDTVLESEKNGGDP